MPAQCLFLAILFLLAVGSDQLSALPTRRSCRFRPTRLRRLKVNYTVTRDYPWCAVAGPHLQRAGKQVGNHPFLNRDNRLVQLGCCLLNRNIRGSNNGVRGMMHTSFGIERNGMLRHTINNSDSLHFAYGRGSVWLRCSDGSPLG